MSREGQSIAITRGHEQAHEISVVNSDTFQVYLRPDTPTPPESAFASYLDLGPFTPDLRMMEAQFQQNPEIPTAQSLETQGGYDDFATRDRMMATTLYGSQERVHAFYTAPGDYENFHFSKGIEGSITEDGDYEVGHDELYALVAAGYDPLMAVHNHPKLGMFGHWDHTVVLQGKDKKAVEAVGLLPFDKRKAIPRLAKASLVLCPDIQILEVVTADTMPVHRDDELEAFIAKWDARLRNAGNDDEAACLEEQRQVIFKNTELNWREEMDTGIAMLAELDKRLKLGQLTAAETAWFFAEKNRIANLSVEDLFSRPEYQVAKMQYLNYTGQASNREFIKLAYEVGVKLYSSTNMKDFYEFSA